MTMYSVQEPMLLYSRMMKIKGTDSIFQNVYRYELGTDENSYTQNYDKDSVVCHKGVAK